MLTEDSFQAHDIAHLLQETFSETLLPSWALHTVGVSHRVKTAGGCRQSSCSPAARHQPSEPRCITGSRETETLKGGRD